MYDEEAEMHDSTEELGRPQSGKQHGKPLETQTAGELGRLLESCLLRCGSCPLPSPWSRDLDGE
jgi:hypothetical protein